jgi:citrate/tricarballylate utilization protein
MSWPDLQHRPSLPVLPPVLVQEGDRLLRICNACRYCEGFCAVFPALEKRAQLEERDITFLANLCHDCGECFYSCQYAPPHQFALDLPRTLAAIRRESYSKYVWPAWLSASYSRAWLLLIFSVVVIPILIFSHLLYWSGASALFSSYSVGEGSFYRLIPHDSMIAWFGILGVGVLIAMFAGWRRFWREMGPGIPLHLRDYQQAVSDTVRLRYLEGGGEGCAYPEEAPSSARRWFHHLTFYGFLLCFAATTVAAIYHNIFGWMAPYPLWSMPVALGSLGGTGLLVGPLGLAWLRWKRDPGRKDPAQSKMDVPFLAMLFLTSLSGFGLLLWRESAAMGTLLSIHLGIVAGFFLTMPYGKFVHGIYRFAALVRSAAEERAERTGSAVKR